MDEAIVALERRGISLDLLCVRAFPFSEEVIDFILEHDQVLQRYWEAANRLGIISVLTHCNGIPLV